MDDKANKTLINDKDDQALLVVIYIDIVVKKILFEIIDNNIKCLFLNYRLLFTLMSHTHYFPTCIHLYASVFIYSSMHL